MKKIALYILTLLLANSCNNTNQKQNGNKLGFDSIAANKITTDKDTIFSTKDKKVLIIGDKEKQTFHLVMSIHFEDFSCKTIFNGVKAHLDLNSNKFGHSYRTSIRNAYQKGVNFAGHYCFIWWGCGSSCYESIIADVVTGKIYDGVNSAWGYDLRKDSRMLIVNPPDSNGNCKYDEVYGSTRIYIFDEKNKKFVEKN